MNNTLTIEANETLQIAHKENITKEEETVRLIFSKRKC